MKLPHNQQSRLSLLVPRNLVNPQGVSLVETDQVTRSEPGAAIAIALRAEALHALQEALMPISQKTILAIYGNLSQLAELVAKVRQNSMAADKRTGATRTLRETLEALEHLDTLAADMQREAIDLMLHDEPALKINPINGEIL
jgi:hypothetical protein